MSSLATFRVGGKVFQQNRIFSPDMRDRTNTCFIELKESLQKAGVTLATEDINPIESAELVIDLNAQKSTAAFRPGLIRYLITTEPPIIHPDNWSSAVHARYNKVFTWNDSLIDQQRYFLLRFAHNLGVESDLPCFGDRQLAAMIIGFKASNGPGELYSARFETIRWFLHNHPEEFDLYGVGWPGRLRPPASQRMERFLSGPINALLGPFYQKNVCYRGPVADKISTFRNYRFAFCYENMHSVPGYITEKIFDAFRAGCVPVYLGPPNTPEHIPADCYIDKWKFPSHEALYKFLKEFPPDDFRRYQERIRTYLESAQARQFRPSHFAGVLRFHILSDLKPGNDHSDKAEKITIVGSRR